MTEHNAYKCYTRSTEYTINRAYQYLEFTEDDKITASEFPYKYYDGPLRDIPR